jgi:hypothetical protein
MGVSGELANLGKEEHGGKGGGHQCSEVGQHEPEGTLPRCATSY